jgi:hypothetical protein
VRRDWKGKHPASKAVIKFRESLGMSHGQFAREILKRAETSVARYETTQPPKGKTLLNLYAAAMRKAEFCRRESLTSRPRSIKHDENFKKWQLYAEIADRFLGLYYEELLREAPKNPFIVGVSRWEDSHAYVLAKLYGHPGIAAAEALLAIAPALCSENEAKRGDAELAIERFAKAVRALQELPDEPQRKDPPNGSAPSRDDKAKPWLQ